MVKNNTILLLLFSAFILLYSCKCPQLAQQTEIITIRDTIVRIDTLIKVQADSIFLQTRCKDTTIYIEKERIKIKTIIKDGFVSVAAQCKEQNFRIVKDITLRMINKVKEKTFIKEKKYIPFWVWIAFGLISIPAVYGSIKIVTKLI